jgi:enoyl-CoA hydratase
VAAAGTIVTDVSDGVARATLCNPARRNAISTAMWRAIAEFADEIEARHDVRVMVVRGEGQAFSGGADITDFSSARVDAETGRGYDDLVEATCRRVVSIGVPTVAVIAGPCVGAGASLAASCDLRVAAAGAFFAVPAAKLGLGYDSRGIARFIRIFGQGATRQLLFTADRLPAERAYGIGAVHALADDAELDAEAMRLVARLVANAPLTIRAGQMAIRALGGADPSLMEAANRLAALADDSADYAEGRAAFAEKRRPRFTGR